MVGVFATLIVFAVNIAFALPLYALALDQVGASATEVGINSAIQAVGVLLAGVYAPRLFQRFGAIRTMVTSTIANAAIDIAMAFWIDPWVWLPYRFLGGFTGATVFIIGEAWIVQATPDAIRGRVLAAYGAGVAAAFGVGPLILPFVGVVGYTPYVVLAGITLVTLGPMWFARKEAPRPKGRVPPSLAKALARAPVAAVAVLFFGVMESAQFTNLPIYAVRSGLDAEAAAFLIAAIGAGGLVLLAPMGWLADRMDRKTLLRLAAMGGALCYAALPFAMDNPPLRALLMFLMGGIAGSLYPISLALLGERFVGDDLAAATGAIIGMYAIGALIGPPTLGFLMDAGGPNALPAAIAAAAAAFAILAGGVFLTARRRDA
jgi:MFS family permease